MTFKVHLEDDCSQESLGYHLVVQGYSEQSADKRSLMGEQP